MTYERDSKKQIWIGKELFRALWILAKADRVSPKSEQDALDARMNQVTADSIGDQMLRQAVREKYPTIFDHMKQQEKAEQAFIKTLQQ